MLLLFLLMMVVLHVCTELPAEWKDKWQTLEGTKELHLPPDNTFIGAVRI